MSKHTPGPWKVEYDNDDSGNSWYCVGPARVPDENDARLISAAPELLEALENALCALEVCGKDFPAMTDARSAISKARGEA